MDVPALAPAQTWLVPGYVCSGALGRTLAAAAGQESAPEWTQKGPGPEDSPAGDNHVHEPARESPAYFEPGSENHSEDHEQKR